MSEGDTVVLGKLHLSSLLDGDWRRDKQGLGGLARLSPLIYFGSDNIDDLTVDGYYNCADLAHFRVAVRELRPKGANVISPDGTLDPATKGALAGEAWEIACPNMFDLDTRNLYFGQLNSDPSNQGGAPPPLELGTLEGPGVKGLPMRLQQVHFRAFNPRGQSDEYAAYFLCSRPVGPFGATASAPAGNSESQVTDDFHLQVEVKDSPAGNIIPKVPDTNYWTYNTYTTDGDKGTAKTDYNGRLVIGDPLRVHGIQMSWGSSFEGDNFPLKPFCPNPKNNVYNMVFDTGGLIIGQRNDPTTQEGFNYIAPFEVVISTRHRIREGSFYRTGKYQCDEQPGWNENAAVDHAVLEWYDGCDAFISKKVLLRPNALGHDSYKPGFPSASAIGSLDGENWEAVPMLQLQDFCNAPKACAEDAMLIPVLQQCTTSAEENPLTPCETTLAKVCLKDIAQYVVAYLFDLINDSAAGSPLNEKARGLVTRVFATECGIRYDYITAELQTATTSGDPLNPIPIPCTNGEGVVGDTNALKKTELLNQLVIGLTNCEDNCSEPPGNTPPDPSPETIYPPCNPAAPIDDPFLIDSSCKPCVADDPRAACDGVPVGSRPRGCAPTCTEGFGWECPSDVSFGIPTEEAQVCDTARAASCPED